MIKSVSPGTNKTYVGYTNNLKLRIEKHNSNKGAKSTKGYKWLLIYSKKFTSKREAMSFEYKLKKDRIQRKKILEKITNENINFITL
jgi:putative endonuclease